MEQGDEIGIGKQSRVGWCGGFMKGEWTGRTNKGKRRWKARVEE